MMEKIVMYKNKLV